MRWRPIWFGMVMVIGSLSVPAAAGDWPQILGPDRTGVASDEQLAETWPKSGPREVWSREIGSGLAGVAVRDGLVVLYHRPAEDEAVTAFDAQTGQRRWEVTFPTRYRSGISRDSGPRCVPVLTEKRIVLHSPEGRLRVLSITDGSEQWSRDLADEYAAPEGYFGAGSTPLVIGDKILVNVGGDKQQAGVVACDLATGKTIWTALRAKASYSSPILTEFEGKPEVVFVTRLSVCGLDPATGQVRFEVPFGQRGPTVNGANAVVIKNADTKKTHFFLTSSYGVGSLLLERKTGGVREVYRTPGPIASQYTTPILVDGLLYGVDGRDDVGPVRMICAEPLTGRVKWSEPIGYGTLVLADGKLLLMEVSGTLRMLKPDGTGYRELATAEVTRNEVRALPALANGHLFVRDSRMLRCFDLNAE